MKPDLRINNNNIESITIVILPDNKRNNLINALSRPPNGQLESFEQFLNNIFKIKKIKQIIPYCW